jgi:hypothetical protein
MNWQKVSTYSISHFSNRMNYQNIIKKKAFGLRRFYQYVIIYTSIQKRHID